MPGAFDFFGRFETSLRTYSKDARPLPECPHGVHSPEECGCDPHHECKRPHCANDIPLDPLCKLSQGTPFGVPVSMWSYHKCYSGGCDSQDTIRAPSIISSEVTERLYSTPTRASTAKLRSGLASGRSTSTVTHDDLGETSDDSSGACLTEKSLGESTASPSSSVDCKDGTNFVSHIIAANPPGNHNQSRKDGISPSPSRRSVSARGRRAIFHQRSPAPSNSSKRSQSSCAAPSIKDKLSLNRNGGRVNESDVTTTSSEPPSSPDASPVATPALTPRQVLSPKNSSYSTSAAAAPLHTRPVGSTPRAAVIRPSAVFAGGRYKVKPVPLNKSASDGVERFRGSFRRGKCNGAVVALKNETAATAAVNRDRHAVVDPNLRSHLARISSDSRVDELLTQAHMVLETLTPEQDASVRSHRSPAVQGTPVLPLVRKLSGESYKDLASIICKKMEEMTQALARSEEQVAAGVLEAERVWLVHRGGFCAARILEGDAASSGDSGSSPPPPGKLALKLEHSGDVIHVDEDDVEKANPGQFDRCEDLASLRHLNESSVLHTLRQRYGSNLIHTYAGGSMVVVNPTTPLAIYSEKVIQMFRGCRQEEMPPHIYSIGQSAYREMVSTRRDQSIVFLGRSGAGKTTNFRHVLHYLALATPSSNSVLTVERLNAISTLLEAFGNSRTLLNTNATRFTQIFSLDYDHTGQIASASIQVYMAEKMRVVRRPEGEPNYHIFYQLLSGADDTLRGLLSLDNLSEPNLFMTPLQRTEDKQKAGIAWARIRAALDVLGVKEGEQRALWRVLAAIYHLGVAGVTTSGHGHKAQFARPASADVAAALLGTTIEELTRAIFLPAHQAPQPRSSFRSSSPLDRSGGRGSKHQWEGLEALEGMAAGLYAEAFNAVVTLMNRCISGSANTVNSILVVDTPGFQNPGSCGRASGASFGDLCHNYTQERLQMLYHDTTFTAQADRYAQEHIECGDVSEALGTPAPLIALIDKPATNSVVRTSQQDLREADRRGLLWLLDEEAIFPGATDQSFLERLFAHYAERDHEQMLQKGSSPDQFVLQHFQGTNPVVYSAQGWLRASRENPVLRQAPTLLQESKKESVSRLFVASRGAVTSSSLVNGPSSGGSVVGIESAQSLRRASSIRRAFTTGTAGIKRRSVALQVKFTVDGIVESLRRTKLRFVHCVLPQHNAGLCELRSPGTLSSPTKPGSPSSVEDNLLNVPLVRSQLRGCQLVEALRLHKQGFPEHMSYQQFRRQFAVLAPSQLRAGPLLDHRAATEAILQHLEMEPSSYRLGLSQVLFRTGGLARLEEQRDAVLAGTITRLQAHARGVLARRRLQKRKVQETAIRCIQKNVRKFMGVREWPWWRLLVRLTPLLDVHRTEHQLREAKTELETLKARLEKVEKEKTNLQQTNDVLEGRLAEVVADLAEEHSTAQLAGERLEAEQADRMRLEKELDTAQGDMRELSIARERLEHEKSVLRVEMLQHASSLNNGDIIEADDASSASLYKRKYEWSQREVETLKQQLRQHQQDEAEQTALLKKQLEKKINDAREETEEQRQVAGQLKKRTQRLQAEMNDLKILLEEQSGRNSLLEKKQRKFDSELAAGQDELRLERLNKEKVMRERDAHLAEKYAVDQELSTLKLELELRDERVAALTRQLDELSVAGHGDHEITQLRKAKHDLETKLKDQEEELDELAGQVQMLEAARTRLEMSHEQMRKEHKKEVQQREEEVEEVRIAAQKKVKALEAQVEAEHEERTQLVRDKHELERRLLELMDRSSAAPDDDTVHRLKKDLRKTKALLKDTQTMLEKSQSEGPSKLIIRQLKTQLEDCEFAKTAALKARQSADADLAEMQTALDDSQRSRKEAEDRASRFLKEKSELQTQLEENEELHAETLKKYKSTVSQISVDQITLSEQSQRIAELEQEKQLLSERLLELNSKVEVLEGETANIHTQRMLQMKVKELESKLELELATKKRIESQVTRLKEQLERVCGECDLLKVKETQGVEQSRKLGRQLRQAKEEAALFEQRNTELNSKKQELEKQMEIMESEISTLKSDLKLAFKRIEDLQMALQGDISDSDSDLSDSDTDSDTSLTSYLTSRATRSTSAAATTATDAVTPPAAPVASAQPNAIDSAPAGRGEDLMSPGSDAMAMIEEAREEDQNSESFA